MHTPLILMKGQGKPTLTSFLGPFFRSAKEQFNNISLHSTCFTVAPGREAYNLCIVCGEIYQLFRPKMFQYFYRIKSLVCEHHCKSSQKVKGSG